MRLDDWRTFLVMVHSGALAGNGEFARPGLGFAQGLCFASDCRAASWQMAT